MQLSKKKHESYEVTWSSIRGYGFSFVDGVQVWSVLTESTVLVLNVVVLTGQRKLGYGNSDSA